MAQKTDIFNEAWCDIVFEDRNKEYGAFELRKQSSKRHLMALISTVVLFTLALVAPTLIDKMIPEEEEAMVEVATLADLKMEKKIEKPKENFIAEPPPPPLKNTIKFTPPVIKPDEEVADDEMIKTQEEVTKTDTKISIADVEGSDDENAVDIADLNDDLVGDEGQVFMVVEQMPEFPGGTEVLMKYIQSNVKYPQIAADNGVSGRVFVSFTVNTDGSIVDIQILRGLTRECDAEAVRVIKSMPKWIPGRQNGTAVRVKYTVPISYILQ